MRKIHTFLVMLIIALLSTAYFSGSGIAGEVTRINKNKGHIFVNEGKGEGFVKGARVCFFSSSDKELLCGTILRTTDNYSVVKVNNRQIKKIKIGTEVRLYIEKE